MKKQRGTISRPAPKRDGQQKPGISYGANADGFSRPSGKAGGLGKPAGRPTKAGEGRGAEAPPRHESRKPPLPMPKRGKMGFRGDAPSYVGRGRDQRDMYPDAPKMAKDCERIYGVNPALAALKSGKRKIQAIYLLDGAGDLAKAVAATSRSAEAKTTYADRLFLNRLVATDSHQGIVVECSAYPLLDETILKKNSASFNSIVLADEIMDPQNLGAIVRNAAFFGCRNLVITKRNCAPVSASVAKASAGNLEGMSVYAVTNLAQAIELLKKQGFWIVGADMEGEDVTTFKRPEKFALVMGGEGKGMRRLTREKCDFIVKISGDPAVESLNVASACGIILHELKRSN